MIIQVLERLMFFNIFI
ncbi:hypothetical protein [Plasmodium yoelii yoelii]|uniref:Uncharacterized protein n=1 Tax=Plasmodium yoelii yoelii TaxID=73239 RepID=Q7RQP0_PLAYO|nr:hypothetical protein [Plasmodium yoelii yoelii]